MHCEALCFLLARLPKPDALDCPTARSNTLFDEELLWLLHALLAGRLDLHPSFASCSEGLKRQRHLAH